ncbi:MAG TPA: efflux RND transporter periplasmic adaptor subunit [bacterium]|nr:efflux RND transporter periplasmic adaptor subunit [bacterium]
MRRWIWILLLVIILLLGGLAVGRLRAPTGAQAPPPETPPVPVEVALVTRQTVERTVDVSGSLTSARVAEVFARQSGPVVRVLVSDGAQVSAGQPLVQLDSAQAAVRVRQAAAAVEAAQARVALLVAGARAQERVQAAEAVRQAESALATARSNLSHARVTLQTMQTNLGRMEMLFREGAVSQSQVDQARWEVDRARTQVESSEAQVRSAESALSAVRQQQSLVETGARPEEVRAARAQMAQAQAVLVEARQALAETTIRAPFAGRVARIQISPGDFVSGGEFGSVPVAVVYDDRAMEAEVTIGEREAALVHPGQPATLRPEIAGSVPLAAAVKTVTPLADARSRAVTVRLRIVGSGGPSAALLPGSSVRGTIVVERRRDALTVPRAALRGDGRPSVWVVTEGKVAVRPVRTALTTGGRVEVLSGVREGEEVIVLGPESITADTRVRVTRRVSR